jgi:hypothetical protein
MRTPLARSRIDAAPALPGAWKTSVERAEKLRGGFALPMFDQSAVQNLGWALGKCKTGKDF